MEIARPYFDYDEFTTLAVYGSAIAAHRTTLAVHRTKHVVRRDALASVCPDDWHRLQREL
ncbi:MAG: hypothetical protein KDB23_22430 [Planctomycetales bacterium]|nr:hypothetical protein [Planctomycetales bacterium]